MYPDSKSKSAALYKRACEVFPGGNSRHTVFFPPYPVYADHGEGCRVTDVDGVERIDFANNYTSLIHGHRHPEIIAAVQAQLMKLTTVTLPTETEIRLAELLCERVAGIDQIRFANSGTEAVMAAIRGARAYNGRPKIAKVEGCYHGGYDFAEISEGPYPDRWGDNDMPASVPMSHGEPEGVLDNVVVLPWNNIIATEKLIEENAGELAAIVIDPLPMRMAFIPADREYLQVIRRVTRQYGIVLIFDEVMSFRLSYNGAQGHIGVIPDMTVLGKIIGGGFPIGAIGGREEFMQVFDPTSGVKSPHSGTFFANPISMTAGLAAMELLTPEMFEHLHSLGERMRQGLQDILSTSGVAGQVRGSGSLCALLLDNKPLHNYRDLACIPDLLECQHELFVLLLNRGVLSTRQGIFIISTVMDENDIDFAIEQTLDAIQSRPRDAGT